MGDYAPGFPEGGDVQWLNAKVLLLTIFFLHVLSDVIFSACSVAPAAAAHADAYDCVTRLLLAVVPSAMRC